MVSVPVFFVTDRNLVPDTHSSSVTFGRYRKYIKDCRHEPFVGTATCNVENEDRKDLTPEVNQLGWTVPADKSKDGQTKVDLMTGRSFSELDRDFLDKVRQAALKSKHKEIVLFVHGYKNLFDSALGRAAHIGYTFEGPVILYSWPSAGKLKSYTSDENNNEWSQEHFNELIERLGEICSADPPLHLRIVAHSMGARLVVRAAPFLREKEFVTELNLVCPDMDAGLVKHYADRYLSTKSKTKIRLYMSRRDRVLRMSQRLHGGYTRMGESADALVNLAVNALMTPVQPRDTSAETVREIQESLKGIKDRLETIDFTEIDTGPLGHHIPIHLICSMSYTNTPGPALELVREDSQSNDRMSRSVSKIAKQQAESPDTAERAWRVVKLPQKH